MGGRSPPLGKKVVASITSERAIQKERPSTITKKKKGPIRRPPKPEEKKGRKEVVLHTFSLRWGEGKKNSKPLLRGEKVGGQKERG